MTTTSSASTDARYAKSLDVWRLLFEAEQLIIGDADYSAAAPHLSNVLDIVSTIQSRLESEQ
jgi:hypothetical protein